MFEDCCFDSVNLDAAAISDSRFVRCRFHNAQLSCTTLQRTRFEACEMIESESTASTWVDCECFHSRFDRVNFHQAQIGGTLFVGCSFADSRFGKGYIADCRFVPPTGFSGADFSDCPIRNCDIRGAGIDRAVMCDTSFDGTAVHGLVGIPRVEEPAIPFSKDKIDFSSDASGADIGSRLGSDSSRRGLPARAGGRAAHSRSAQFRSGPPRPTLSAMPDSVLKVFPLGFPWQTQDPFLFCVHHDDAYPRGNAQLGPAASLAGRDIGQDFAGKDGWRMYHGDVVPGFPQHPHRGFETVTIVRRGLVDHSDSLGATARFGRGDVQWLTAGRGIVHSEMFPLVETEKDNPLELFQIWLNLPSADKMVEPHFSMLWAPSVPELVARDEAGRTTRIKLVAGAIGDTRAPAPPPRSWASRADAEVAIWTLALEPHASWVLPAASVGTNRTLYVFRGQSVDVDDETVKRGEGASVRADVPLPIQNGAEPAELLVLQGRPIGEPVVQYGPFVMNSRQEIQRAFLDYQQTQFGGWPWPSDGPAHPRSEGRFAKHVDGRIERIE